MSNCRACRENEATVRGENQWAVAELTTGYVLLNPTQYYRGSSFFVARKCVSELHELSPEERSTHLIEMAAVAHAVYVAFQPRKMNYEALGNSVPHLHWWLTPRHHDDQRPVGPIWEDHDFLRVLWTNGEQPTPDDRDALRHQVLEALEANAEVSFRRLC